MLDAPPRYVGLDVGTKRVGVAVADPLGLTARPHGTYPPAEAVAVVGRLRAADGLAALVVGWPLTPDGAEGRACARVQAFLNRLANALGDDLPLVRRDERFTTEMAKDLLQDAGVAYTGPGQRGRLDAAAAVLILQDYLDEVRGV